MPTGDDSAAGQTSGRAASRSGHGRLVPSFRRSTLSEGAVRISIGSETIEGLWCAPPGARAAVILAQASGSGRYSSRNRFIAQTLEAGSLATLVLDLLTTAEEHIDAATRQYRFDIRRLKSRLVAATDWLAQARPDLAPGYFGVGTGGAAALWAAALRPQVAAVVSRSGQPDLARGQLEKVRAATLLIVGSSDNDAWERNKQACDELVQATARDLRMVPGASQLFDEPGKLALVARLAAAWFTKHLPRAGVQPPTA